MRSPGRRPPASALWSRTMSTRHPVSAVRCCARGAGFPARHAIRSRHACSGSTARCWPITARRAGGRPAHRSRSPWARSSRSTRPGAAPPRRWPRCAPVACSSPHRLAAPRRVDAGESLVRPAGTYRLKARRLLDVHPLAARSLRRRFPRHAVARRWDPCAARCLPCPASGPRRPTRSFSTRPAGPVFVADAYTRRVLARHRLHVRPRRVRGDTRVRSKRTCRPIPRSSTSSTRCWSPSPRSHCRTVPHCACLPAAIRSRRPPAGARARLRGIGGALTRRSPAAGRRVARPHRGWPGPVRARPSP